MLASENIRFSSLFTTGDVSCGETYVPLHETSPVVKSAEKRMFSQAIKVSEVTLKNFVFFDITTFDNGWRLGNQVLVEQTWASALAPVNL